MAAATGLSWRSRPTTTRWASGRSVRTLASASTKRQQPLEGDVGAGGRHDAARDPGDVRPGPEVAMDRRRSEPPPAAPGRSRTASTMSRLDEEDTVRILGIRRATRFCMARNPYQRRRVSAAPPALGVVEVQGAIDGDGVVAGAHQRPSVRHDPEQTRSERLIVVDHVVLPGPDGEGTADPPAERAGLGKAGGAHHGELGDVDSRSELPRPGHPEGIRLPVQVETRHRNESHPVIEDRPGLAGEHGDPVAEIDQLTGQVAGVHALTAGMRIAAVHEQGDPEGGAPGHEAQTVVRPDSPVKLTAPGANPAGRSWPPARPGRVRNPGPGRPSDPQCPLTRGGPPDWPGFARLPRRRAQSRTLSDDRRGPPTAPGAGRLRW